MTFFDRSLRIASHLRRHAGIRIESASIALGKRYRFIDAPPADPSFAGAVWESGSPLATLLGANERAAEDAERLMRYEMRLFSSRFTFEAGRIPWNRDVFSGFSYPNAPHPGIGIEQDKGHDIIVPWELSRLQFIPTIIQAHRLRRDERLDRFFRAVVDDWIARNPYRFGVNWMTGMDVALRAINLALGLAHFGLLEGSGDWYRKVLWAHAEYLDEKDLRNPPRMRNNHFMISVVGALVLSLVFKGRKAERLFALATEHLDAEILRQFREDGGNFESAVHYHQLTLEAVLVALCFLQTAAGEKSSDLTRMHRMGAEIEARIEQGINLVFDYMTAFGRSPQFGDSSDTRVLIHRDYFDWNPLDHSFIADLAGVALPGKRRLAVTLCRPVYPRSGYGFFSSRRYGICCNASPVVEDGHGGHNHCDKTSFVLRVHDAPVFIDAGTFCYTPDVGRRYAHRRTGSHNLVVVDGCEQAPMDPNDVFQAPIGIAPSIRYEGGDTRGTWIMQHQGYRRLPGIGAVKRTIRCFEGHIEIEEEIDGTGEHAIEIMYHLFPGIEYRNDGSSVRLARDGSRLCSLEIPKHYELIATNGLYSPAYRQTLPAVTLVLSRRSTLPEKASYAIVMS
jgi:hypothetical protein